MPLGGRGRRRHPHAGGARRAGDRDRRRLRLRARGRARGGPGRGGGDAPGLPADRGEPPLGARRDARGDQSPGRARRAAPGRSTRRRSSAAAGWPSHAAGLLEPGTRALTHCNAGALATGGVGTALGAIREGFERGLVAHVLVDETRPLLQGARLTAWELERAGVPHSVVADAAAGSLIARGEVDAVLTGADRIAANGDTANKIGTYPLAVLAARHGVPFYVVAPSSTVDLDGRERRRHPDRGARPGRGERPLPGAEPGLRRDAGRAGDGDRHGGGRAPRAVRRVAGGPRRRRRSRDEGDGDGRRAGNAAPPAHRLPAEADDAGRQPAGPAPPPEPAPPPRRHRGRDQPARVPGDDPALLRRRRRARHVDPVVGGAGAPRHRRAGRRSCRTTGATRRS